MSSHTSKNQNFLGATAQFFEKLLFGRYRYNRIVHYLAFAILMLPIISVGFLGYRMIDRMSTDDLLSDKRSVVELSSRIVYEQLMAVQEIGISLASRPRFIELVGQGDWEGAGKNLGNAWTISPLVGRVFVTDSRGTIKIDSLEESNAVGTNRNYRPWFKATMKKGLPYVSGVFKRITTPQINVVNVAIPIRTDGQIESPAKRSFILGVLVLQLKLSTIADWVKDIRTNAGETLTALDQNNCLLYYRGISIHGTIVDYSRYFSEKKPSGIMTVNGFIHKGPQQIVYKKIPDFDWTIALEESTANYFSRHNHQMLVVRHAVWAVSFLSGCFIFIVYLLLRANRRNREQLQFVTDNVPAVMYQFKMSKGGKMGFVYVSDRAREMFGLSPEEMTGDFSKIWGLLGEGQKTAVIKSIHESARTLEPWDFDIEYRHLDGSSRWIRGSSIPKAPERDGAVIWTGSFADVTRRKQIEKELTLRNVLLSVQNETCNDGILVVGDGDEILSFNSRYAKMWKIPPEVLISGDYPRLLKLVSQRVTNPEGYIRRIKALYQDRTIKSYDEFLLADGRTFERYSSPMFGPGERYYGRVWYFHDITARKKADKELRASYDYLYKILDAMADPLFVKNRKHEFVLANRAFCEFMGHKREELIGKTDHAFWPKEQADILLEVNEGVFRDKKVSVTERSLKDAAGRVRTISSSKSYYKDEQKNEFVVTSIKDITERRKAEEDLKKAYHELQSTQAQLVQSEKMASIGQLAAGVAHEINNPIGFIGNNMEILGQYVSDLIKILRIVEGLKTSVEKEDIQKSKNLIKEMERFENEIDLAYLINDFDKLLKGTQGGLERVRKIVQDLRTFARESDGETEPFKIEEVIDSILSIVSNEIKYKAELRKNYGETPLVRGSTQGLGQVFINLLVNAVQAIEGRGLIEIKTYTKDHQVCAEVTDTGKGIKEEHISRIFDPFFTTKPVGKGTGLGLSISSEIIKKHNGRITVRSKPGEGTTFTVMLPVS